MTQMDSNLNGPGCTFRCCCCACILYPEYYWVEHCDTAPRAMINVVKFHVRVLASVSFLAMLSEAFLPYTECDSKGLHQLHWYDAASFALHGRAFNNTVATYHRLPATAQKGEGPGGKGPVRSPVWDLQSQPAGQFIQFKSDASCVFVRYTIASAVKTMWHFPSTGRYTLSAPL